MKTKKLAVITFFMAAMMAVSAIGVSANPKQIYSTKTKGSVTAKGSLYGYAYNGYITVGTTTTRADGSGTTVQLKAYLYANGTLECTSYNPNYVALGNYISTDSVLFTSSDNISYISSKHGVNCYNGTVLTPARMTLTESQIQA